MQWSARNGVMRIRLALFGACLAMACDDESSRHDASHGGPDASLAAGGAIGAGGATAQAGGAVGAGGAATHADAATDAATTVGHATARATLVSVSASDAAPPVNGTAVFRATSSGVDLEVHTTGCAGLSAYPVTIVDATDCTDPQKAPIWSDGGGENVPGVYCLGTSLTGAEFYSRSSALRTHWSIGDGAPSDLIGHAVIVHDPVTSRPLACGVIEAGPDTPFVSSPPLDQPPSVAVRAQLAGACVLQSLSSAGPATCPDQRDFVECVAEHCDLGGCIDSCTGYSSCLDGTQDKCASGFTCPMEAACNECSTNLWECASGYCAGKLLCSVKPTPGGPCDQLRACCAVQGAGTRSCLDTFGLLIELTGDSSCESTKTDWDVIAHLGVPCQYESVPAATEADGGRPGGSTSVPIDAGSALKGAPCESDADCGGLNCVGATRGAVFNVMGTCRERWRTDQLGDGVAGRACQVDADCGAGRCDGRAPIGIAFPGNLCTGDCYSDAECGAGGVCLWLHQLKPGLCLQSCASESDCTRPGYRCMPLGDGQRVIHACYPGGDPLPDGVVGRACTGDGDCGARAGSCRSELSLLAFGAGTAEAAPGGYCTQSCYFDADCGKGAHCVSGGPGGGLCFASCSPSAPCRNGYQCMPRPSGGDPTQAMCVPATATTP